MQGEECMRFGNTARQCDRLETLPRALRRQRYLVNRAVSRHRHNPKGVGHPG